eukprot:TRINITY_DN40350_c0_g1_i1.p1 TRINITY_DN40350_c0_g1~~TRINITY_DN40350_c0_g1_i1.p1  ORF type:complete len:244 (+),score=48.47 TRINITY_DN40350_c0_g1_i1:61-792(+)
MASNSERQAEEIDALQSIFCGDGEFEMQSDAAPDGKSPASFRVLQAALHVVVTLPVGYPDSDSPSFSVQGLKASQAGAVNDRLVALAKERVGEECVFDVLGSLQDLLAEVGVQDDAAVGAAAAVGTTRTPDVQSPWGWAYAEGSNTVLRMTVNSGPKVKATQIANFSELRRMPQTRSMDLDVQPSRNTENYEIAHFLATAVGVSESQIEFVVGTKKEKATGDRQVKVLGQPPETVVERIVGAS